MKKIYYLIALSMVIFFALGTTSCSKDETDSQNQQVQTDKEKLEEMIRLFESYGWERDPDVSEEERNKMLLEVDIDTFKAFLEFFKTGGTETDSPLPPILNTDTAQTKAVTPRALSYIIRGEHHSAVIDSRTTMTLSYNWPDATTVTVTKTTVESNPSSVWTPDAYSTFNFSGTRCDVSATGTGKSYGIIKKMIMKGNVNKSASTNYITDGKVSSFREA